MQASWQDVLAQHCHQADSEHKPFNFKGSLYISASVAPSAQKLRF